MVNKVKDGNNRGGISRWKDGGGGGRRCNRDNSKSGGVRMVVVV